MTEIIKDWDRTVDDKGKPVVFYEGDTRTYTFTIQDADGVAVDISGKTIRFRCNEDADKGSGTNKIFEKDGTLTGDGTDGKVDIELTPVELDSDSPGEDRHLFVIDITGGNQSVLTHSLVDILPEPDAA